MLRTKFLDSTLLTVAHRLNTIMDYDYILCISEGTRTTDFKQTRYYSYSVRTKCCLFVLTVVLFFISLFRKSGRSGFPS